MKTLSLSLVFVAGFTLSLTAQQPAIRMSMPEMGAFEMMSVEAIEFGQAVTGAPYSAQAVTEIIQQLADGNRIERRSSSTIARDSQGRVRREQQVAAIGPLVTKSDAKLVTIVDPVAGVSYTLNEARRVAMRMPAAVFARAGGTVAGTRVMTSGGMNVAIGGVGTGAPSGIGFMATEAVHAASFEAHNSTRQLPSQQMEGVLVDGTRSTMTIPAGQVGNLQPIAVVTERWFSKELNAVVMSRTSDPRFGETIYRLENIVRSEPSPELFQVPADYQIQGMPGLRSEPEAK